MRGRGGGGGGEGEDGERDDGEWLVQRWEWGGRERERDKKAISTNLTEPAESCREKITADKITRAQSAA